MSPSTASTPSAGATNAQRNPGTPEGEEDRPPARSATPQQAEAFAKLLRRKAGDEEEEASPPPMAGLLAPPRSDRTPNPALPSGPVGVQAAGPSATAEALRCAQVHGPQGAAPLAVADSAPNRWEVRLGDPQADGLHLRATASSAPTTAVMPAAPTWELSLSSSQLGAQTLARHAPRLSERLRARGVDHDGVLVQGRHPRHTPQDESGDELA